MACPAGIVINTYVVVAVRTLHHPLHFLPFLTRSALLATTIPAIFLLSLCFLLIFLAFLSHRPPSYLFPLIDHNSKKPTNSSITLSLLVFCLKSRTDSQLQVCIATRGYEHTSKSRAGHKFCKLVEQTGGQQTKQQRSPPRSSQT